MAGASEVGTRIKRALWAKQVASQIMGSAFQEHPEGGEELVKQLQEAIHELNKVVKQVKELNSVPNTAVE